MRYLLLSAVFSVFLLVSFSLSCPVLAAAKGYYQPSLDYARGFKTSFLKGDYVRIEAAIGEARAKGYTPWKQQSYTALFFKTFRASGDEEERVRLTQDLDRAMRWVEARPQSSYAYTYRGETYVNLGWDARGSKFVKETPQENFARMSAYFKNGAQDLLKAISLDPKNEYAWEVLISMSRANHSQFEQEKFFQSALREVPNYLFIYQKRLEALHPKWGGSYEEMRDFVDAYAGMVNLNLAMPFLELWYLRESISWRAYELYPYDDGKDERYKPYSAYVQKALNDPKILARMSYLSGRLFKALPYYSYGYKFYAGMLNDAERFDKDMEYYARALELDPKLFKEKTAYRIARRYSDEDKKEEAAVLYKIYLDTFPEGDLERRTGAAEYVGWMAGTKGQYPESERYYRIALDLAPQQARSQTNYCNALLNLSKYEEAKTHCSKSIAIDKGHSWAYYLLSEIYKRQGDLKTAQSYARKYESAKAGAQ